MKESVFSVNVNLKHSKFFEWSKLILVTGSAQFLIQAIGFISGILVIRLLSTKEYAFYTIINSLLGTMTLIADSGISSSVMAQGGQAWNNREKLGEILSTAIKLRRPLGFGAFIIFGPVLCYMLYSHGASLYMALLMTIALIPVFILTLSGGLLEISLKLNQNIIGLQSIQVRSNLLRLFLLGLTTFVFPLAFFAICSAGISQLWANLKLRRKAGLYADLKQGSDPVVRKKILHIVRKLLPTSVYYAFSGQMTIWLISLFGSTIYVAQLGALGRLAMILSLFNIMYGVLIVPRLAKLPDDSAVLFRRFIQTQIFLFFFYVFIISCTWVFSSQLLWILGDKYTGLNKELVLTITGSCVSLLAGSCFVFYTSRGWAIKPLVVILFDLSAIIIGLNLFNVTGLDGVLRFTIYMGAMLWALNFSYSLYKISRVLS